MKNIIVDLGLTIVNEQTIYSAAASIRVSPIHRSDPQTRQLAKSSEAYQLAKHFAKEIEKLRVTPPPTKNISNENKKIHSYEIKIKAALKIFSNKVNDASMPLLKHDVFDMLLLDSSLHHYATHEDISTLAQRKQHKRLEDIFERGIPKNVDDHCQWKLIVPYYNSGVTSLYLGKLKQASHYLSDCLTRCERYLDSQNAITLLTKKNISYVYFQMGEIETSETYLDQTIKGVGKKHGMASIHLLDIHYRKAEILVQKGEYQRAISRVKSTIPPTKQTTYTSALLMSAKLNLSRIYCLLKDEQAQLKYLKEAISLGLTQPNTTNTKILDAFDALAHCYASKGNLEHAIWTLKHVLSKKEIIYGDHHPETITTLANLVFFESQQDPSEIEHSTFIFAQCINKLKNYFGPVSWKLIPSLLRFSELLTRNNQQLQGVRLLDDITSIIIKELGQKHPLYTKIQFETAYLYLEPSPSIACDLFSGLLTHIKDRFSDRHPKYIEALQYMAAASFEAKPSEFALEAIEQCVKMNKLIKCNRLATISSLDLLGNCYLAFEKEDLAFQCFEERYQYMIHQYGEHYKELIQPTLYLADIAESLGDIKQSLFYLDKLSVILTVNKQKNTMMYCEVLERKAVNHSSLRDYSTANDLLLQAIQIQTTLSHKPFNSAIAMRHMLISMNFLNLEEYNSSLHHAQKAFYIYNMAYGQKHQTTTGADNLINKITQLLDEDSPAHSCKF